MNAAWRRGLAGLTLVEVAVIMVILFGLAGMLLPALRRAREVGHPATCKSNLNQVGRALATYATDYGWMIYLEDSPHSGDSLAMMYPKFISQPRVLRCPNTEDEPEAKGEWEGGAYRAWFGKVEDGRGTSYGYDHRVYKKGSAEHAIVADMDGTSTDPAAVPPYTSNHDKGMNVLYFDYHVKWSTTNYCSNDGLDNIFARQPGWDPDTDSLIQRTAGD